jgi:hypothetical protein
VRDKTAVAVSIATQSARERERETKGSAEREETKRQEGRNGAERGGEIEGARACFNGM